MSTIPTINRTLLGCVSSEVAAAKRGRGDPDAYVAGVLADVAEAAKADIEALEGGGGGITSFRVAEPVLFDVNASSVIGTITGAQTTGAASDSTHGLHTLTVVFPNTWPTDKSVTLTGKGRDGATQTETFAPPTSGGATVRGSKTFVGTITITGTGGGSAGLTAQVQIGRHLCVANAPISEVIAVYENGQDHDISGATISLPNGTIDLGIGDTIAATYYVIYTVVA